MLNSSIGQEGLSKLNLFFFVSLLLVFANFGLADNLTFRRALQTSTAESRVKNASSDEIAAARALIEDVRAKVDIYNQNRLDHPFISYSPPSNRHSKRQITNDTLFTPPPPLFQVTEAIAKAAALLAEVDAANATLRQNPTKREELHKRAGSWWMANKQHRGAWPWGRDSSYQVFRDVTDGKWATDGAARCVADGKTDCTAAINNAMKAGKRCGAGCNGSTTKQAILYFPSGTYLISGTIEIYFGTQMIGDATNPPTILASSSFVGLGMFSVDHYVENGGVGPDGNAKEWYINTANFYRQIRNFVFDLRQAGDTASADKQVAMAGIHYQVGQATSLTNLKFLMSGAKQHGVYAENGSGGHLSDLTFQGGGFGIWGGSQQFTAQRITFSNVDVAVHLIWDWGFSFKGINVLGGNIGFKLISADGTGPHNTGSIILIDSVFRGTKTAIEVFPASSDLKTGTTGITLENILFTSVGRGVVDTSGKVYLAGGQASIQYWILGPTYMSQSNGDRTFTFGDSYEISRRDDMLSPDNKFGFPLKPYFDRAKPQYEDTPWSNFVSVKSAGAKGDGATDDSGVLNDIISTAAANKLIVFFDAGTYILKDTVKIPAGARIVGEAWAQITAQGPNFSDADKPRPLIRVGDPGDNAGSVEIQDLLFTTKGPTAGVVLIEWNLKADGQGAAGMWDCHVRVGGAVGTDLTSTECPPSASASTEKCTAGNMMMHLTPSASAYLENVWLWVGDHDIDDPDQGSDDSNNMVQCSIFVRRGLLIESTGPVWLYGTAVEHAVMYQYNFYQAESVFATMIQTESPYYQPSPQPPSQFSSTQRGLFNGDNLFENCPGGPGCDASWALMIRESNDIYIAGAGLYSWFSSYDQTVCVDASNCQKALIQLVDNGEGVQINNLITIGATTMIVSGDDLEISAADNAAVSFHPFWSQITAFGVANSFDDSDDDDDLPDTDLQLCTINFPNLAILELAYDEGHVESYCQTEYTLVALKNMYQGAVSDFQELLRNSYDKMFKYYAEGIAKTASDQVTEHTNSVGNKYFTCVVGELGFCCKDCKDHSCKYCVDKACTKTCVGLNCGHKKRDFSLIPKREVDPPTVSPITYPQKIPEPCPPDYSQRGYGSNNPYKQSVWWTLPDKNRNAFFADLLNATGIPSNKIAFKDRDRGNTCTPAQKSHPNDDCWILGMDFNFPQPQGYEAQDVTNPKDIIQKAIDKAGNMGTQLEDAVTAIKLAGYRGDEPELIDSVTLPILTIAAAVDAMKEIEKAVIKSIEAFEKKLILLFVNVVLLLLPIVGGTVGSFAGLAEVGAIISLFGDAGGFLYDLYSLAEEPHDTATLISLILTPLGLTDLAAVSKASRIKRTLPASEIAKFGPAVKRNDEIIDKVIGTCRRK
ncbi:hypothetical protein TWF694_007800 [Orbilia ellipsospora]|uniref:Rhamnogalacturonase A/B/Epimerase-like pectate lyase domain-containing protein n=1 Tax=Orbilia ellipsospora TaxID=2528407 RepID=A0AAV9XJ99_9PEZI